MQDAWPALPTRQRFSKVKAPGIMPGAFFELI
jgi:hypothetical protein